MPQLDSSQRIDASLRVCLQVDLARQWKLLHPEIEQTPSAMRLFAGVFSPRFVPVLLCRLAHALYLARLGPLAKSVSLINFFLFGIEIAVRCPIGPGLFLPHTQGTVIGAWRIGRNATIFQGVTLGAREVDFSYTENSRPTLEDDVTIGAGAKILGGLLVESGARIGANSVVLRSVPANSLAVGAPARIVTPTFKRE